MFTSTVEAPSSVADSSDFIQAPPIAKRAPTPAPARPPRNDEALAADDAFQQEAVARVAGARAQLQVEGQRGFEIRKGLADQRDAVVAFGCQALEFEFGDHGVKP